MSLNAGGDDFPVRVNEDDISLDNGGDISLDDKATLGMLVKVTC